VLLIAAGIAARHFHISQSEAAKSVGRILLVAAVLAHGLAFAYILRRYVVGIRELANWQIMITNPGWQPPLGWLALCVAYVALVAVAAHCLYGYVFPGAVLLKWPPRLSHANGQRDAAAMQPTAAKTETESRSGV
jgi:hypothetical protein